MDTRQANSDQADGWNRESIKAALRSEGYTLARLDRLHGRKRGYFSQALTQPMPKAEVAIAEILGVEPQTIWPARYGPDGRSLRGRFLPEADAPRKRSARQPEAGNVS